MFNYQELLNPINETKICGEDISFSRDIDAISEARRFDDATLDQGEWVTDIKTANWPFVIESCSALLASKSKDLRVAVWLTEASAKAHQFAGLAEGYILLTGLCDIFWDGLYPLPDGEDQEQRIGNLHWILSRSIQLVKEMPVTEGPGITYSILDYETASALNGKVSSDHENSDEPLKYVDFETAKRNSSAAFYKKLLEDIKHCQFAIAQLELAVDARLGINGPGFSAAKNAIEDALKLIARFIKELGIDMEIGSSTSDLEEPLSESGAQGSTLSAGRGNGPIQSRSQALAQLRSIAEFFRRTEPHSPVAYLADKAAYWGEMSLHNWLTTVVKDPAVLSHIEDLLGLESAKQND